MAELTPYPARRTRYRRDGDSQDTVILELRVAPSLIPWLEQWSTFFGPSVEETARFLILASAQELQRKRWAPPSC